MTQVRVLIIEIQQEAFLKPNQTVQYIAYLRSGVSTW